MDYKIFYYTDVTQEQWGSWVARIRAASYHHTRYWLGYCSGFQNVSENRSFVLAENDSTPLAVCPLLLTEIDGHREISANGAPVGVPALVDNLKPSLRRRVLDSVFSIINSYAAENCAERILVVSHPLVKCVCEEAISGFNNSFELLRYRMLYRVENTLVIDLELPLETLSLNMGKYQRRHISRGKKQNIRIEVFNAIENKDRLKEYFERFQKAHFACAGRLTRPQATWDSMYQAALNACASLFCAFLGDTPISYLFCGELVPMAFGWSQVNIGEFEKDYSPRHILEWEAMLYYKKQGYKYYEVGERYFCPQPLYVPSTKEITISEFKERYGGFMLPKVYWLGYYDKKRMREDLKQYQDSYLSNDNLVKTPGGSNGYE